MQHIFWQISLPSVCQNLSEWHCCSRLKVARYSFSGSIPPKSEDKIRHYKQRFRKIATTIVLDKDKNLL